MEVIISTYFRKFVVVQAKTFTRNVVVGQRLEDRGYNIFGEHLGHIERDVIDVRKTFIEGDALSRSYNTLAQAEEFVRENGYKCVKVQ